MSTAAAAFVKEVAALSPTISELLQDHLQDNFGELLPHLFVGDIARHLVALVQTPAQEDDLSVRRELKTVLEAMEAGYASGSPDLQGLIAASFLENLPTKGEPGWEIREMVGPELSRQLRVMA